MGGRRRPIGGGGGHGDLLEDGRQQLKPAQNIRHTSDSQPADRPPDSPGRHAQGCPASKVPSTRVPELRLHLHSPLPAQRRIATLGEHSTSTQSPRPMASSPFNSSRFVAIQHRGARGVRLCELMGHRAARTGDAEARGSAIGAVYRHLTPEMQAARVLAAVDECLAVALKALAAQCGPRGQRWLSR